MPTIAEKWVQEGVEKKEIEITEKMISLEMNNTEIRKITGLSIKKISQIRLKHQSK